MNTVLAKAKKEQLNDWTDLWFSEHKKAGFVAVKNLKKQYFYGNKDINPIIKATENKKKRYISINAFDVDWETKKLFRGMGSLKQIRNIAIDIDQYKFETGKRKRMKVIIRKSEPDKRIAQFYKTNYARLSDLRRLIELRKGDFTGMRNVFLYIYSFHQSLVLNTQKDVIWSVRRAFQDVFSKTEGQLSNTEFEKTVKGAYHDAREFFDHYKGNGYIVVFNHT